MNILLQKGSKGEDVRLWQKWLLLDSDGVFGDRTEQATRVFQKAQGLGVDGKVGPKTFSAAVKLGFKGFDTQAGTLLTKSIATPTAEHTAIVSLKGQTSTEKINAAMLARLAPRLQQKLLVFIEAAQKDGVELRIVQGLRTFAEQEKLYAQGRIKPGKIVTNAKPGQSFHNYGLAADLAPIVDGKVSWNEKLYAPYKKWAEKAGLRWGGNWTRFKDLPHVEFTNGLSLRSVQGLYRSGLAAVWDGIED